MNHVSTVTQQFTITPLAPTIGAEIGNIDLRQPLAPVTRDGLYQALLDWKVIFFRDQDITREQHMTFSASFGELEIHPFAPSHVEHPEMLRITHDGDHPGSENSWHSDVTWRTAPPLGSVLRLLEAPPVGGDTLFADMGAAYRGLPKDIRDRVTGLNAVHDFEFFRRRLVKKGASAEKLAALDAKYPNPEHPVIRTHPDTGEQQIFVNRGFTRRIVGVSEEESARLLDILCDQADFPEYQCRFKWQPNSIAFWDNRACQHYAVSDYWPERRTAERATIIGDVPVYRPSVEPVAGPDDRIRGTLRRWSTDDGDNNVSLRDVWSKAGK